MTALVWDKPGEHIYELGLDRGVLYLPEGGGVAWNGLLSVDESNNSSVQSVYFDGVKINDIATVEDFVATLTAYTYPDEFLRFEGTLEDPRGMLVTAQPIERFHLSYRTLVGNDIEAESHAYKIHILWNVTAIPTDRQYATMSSDAEAIEFEWSLTAIPEQIEGFRPTAHVIIDTRKVDPLLVEDIETILYGDEENEPRLPSLRGLSAFLRKWDRLIITDNGDGTWSATENQPGYITMLDPDTFEITSDTAVYLDADTYEISSTEREDEDL